MSTHEAFDLIRDDRIDELNSRARLYRHRRTGARLLSLENDDENKVFGIGFPTPPEDSTGLPHILEHVVLAGSRKYPVKEPFVELLKGSLNTFVNAMTFSDMTLYPVASQNLKDFYNLIDVYLDAVLYPNIAETTFQQEGWHFELEDTSAPLTFKGVVYNEMKGAYSSPDNYMDRLVEATLLPDTPYGLDSGGDPALIPDLTYEQFTRFHRNYYHPSNAFIYFYGDDDPAERLRLIDDFITEFEANPIDVTIPLQPRFAEPRRIVEFYDAGEESEDDSEKGMVTLTWLLNEATDLQSGMALYMLAYILTETPASPLRKALVDSGLGEDLTGGFSPYQRELYFGTGLKGIHPDGADEVEALILDTLRDLVQNGIDPDMIEAAINTIEFQLRENNTGSYPRGLALLMGMLTAWMQGADPIEAMRFEDKLAALKAQLQADPRYFESLIQQYLLDNPHRVTLIMQPDSSVAQQRAAAEQQRLDQARAAMQEADLQKVVDDTLELRRLQAAPDSPEALATIPRVQLTDIEREIKPVPIEVSQVEGTTVLYHDLPTNGIVYLDLGLNLHTLPADLLPYVNLYGGALLEMGTHQQDFVKLTQRIGRKTGGLDTNLFTSAMRDSDQAQVWLMLRGKVMVDQAGDLLAILTDILTDVNLDNRDRFRQMVLEEKSTAESYLIPAGHGVVLRRLRAHFNEADWATERMNGVDYLFFLRDLVNQIDRDWAGVLAKLQAVHDTLINRQHMLVNVTVEADGWEQFQPQLADFLTGLPAQDTPPATWQPTFAPQPEGLTLPAQVNYVGMGANIYEHGYDLHGSYIVILKFLRTTYLWEKIRVQGGAYGAMVSFDQYSGVLGYASYRDPNLLNTLQVYQKTGDFLRGLDLSQDELERAIIGAISDLDKYLLPDAKGYASMLRYLLNFTDADRQQLRDDVLATTQAHFHQFAEALDAVARHGLVVVLGSPDAIAAANQAQTEPMQVTRVL